MALAIMSVRRAADDDWAHEVERRLRALIRAEVDAGGPTISRVFCNSMGCLCYTERAGDGATAAGFTRIRMTLGSGRGWPRKLGTDRGAVHEIAVDGPPDFPGRTVWQLVFVMRNAPQN